MKNNDLTNGNVKKLLLSFALPYFAAVLLQALYGAADLFVVGMYNGASAISAVNIGSQIMQIISFFVIGCSMGCTVLIGRHIGAGEGEKAARVLGSAIIMFAALAVVLAPAVFFAARGMSVLMRTPAEALDETVRYISICAFGIPFIIAFNVSSAVLRGAGDSKTPMIIVIIACVINIFGDLLLTGVLKMGVTGVAIATSAAQMISSVCGIIIMAKHGLPFKFTKKDIAFGKRECVNILKVGLPIAMQDTIINISFVLITVIANLRGLTSSSAVGVVEKLIMFMFLVPDSMLSSISAFTAQNIGAGKKYRAVEALKFGVAVTAAFGIAACALSWICPHALTGIFTSDPAVKEAADEYLKTYSIDCILVAFTLCVNGYLCGMEKSMVTFTHNVISTFLVRIPAAYFLSAAFTDTMLPMGLASPLGSVASIIILAIYFAYAKKHGRES